MNSKTTEPTHLFPFESTINRTQRCALLNQNPRVVWFTGLSGSGKSTLALQLEYQLHRHQFKTYLLDGDNVRTGLNKDLGFSNDSRKENIRRIGEVSKLFLDAGLVVLSAFISPFQEDKDQVREIVGSSNFTEVFVDCPLPVCEERDLKSLYKKARAGVVKNFTGIDSPYEVPPNPDIRVKTDTHNVEYCVRTILSFIQPLITFSQEPHSLKKFAHGVL